MFDEALGIAGQIDFLAVCPDGTFAIVDWKRSKKSNRPDERAFARGKHLRDASGALLPENNYYKYALQLNLYRHLLEAHYEVRVSRMLLVRIHPEMGEGAFEVQEVEPMPRLVEQCISHGLREGVLGAGASRGGT